MKLLYEGKAKYIYDADQEGLLHVTYKDEVTAGNGAKKDKVPGKGRLNNLISAKIFQYLKEHGVKSHFVEQLSETEQLVQAVDIIPLEVVVRNIATGSITKRLGFEKGTTFEQPLVCLLYTSPSPRD